MNRRSAPLIVANPILVGAATMLIAVVGVFLAYNANSGLPFVPTYNITANVPDAAELGPGNEVRIGGARVGVIASLRAEPGRDGHVYAKLGLKLNQGTPQLPVDTRVTVRPRSTLGLKYLELIPGRSRRTVASGGTLPERNAGRIVELDEVLNAFDKRAREGLTGVLDVAGPGVAGRGGDLNAALGDLRPLVTHLGPVMQMLAAPRTDLRGMIDGISSAATAVAPVTAQLGGLVTGAADTFGAIDRAGGALDQILAESPSTVATATRVAAAVRPVLTDAVALARALRPATPLLAPTTRRLAVVVETGTPVLRKAIATGPDLEATLRALGALATDPATPVAVAGLTEVVASLQPTLRWANPFQTVCNYLGLWTRNAASTISEGDENGTWFRFIPVYNVGQTLLAAKPAGDLHVTPYGRFHGVCEVGNEGFEGTQLIGHQQGSLPNRTETTTPPAGTPEGPR